MQLPVASNIGPPGYEPSALLTRPPRHTGRRLLGVRVTPTHATRDTTELEQSANARDDSSASDRWTDGGGGRLMLNNIVAAADNIDC